MAGNNVLAAGLLMVICVQFGSSEVVPDGVVYTEVKKTLVQGIPGVLTCRFYGDPFAVYWKKGSNPDDASLMLLWHEGQVSGPRYNDGSCDIDENYSLIIKNISLVDAGRYYCVVSNYLGVLINNYTDVSLIDTAIETKSQVILQMRPFLLGEVKCIVHIRPRTVSWIKKGTATSSGETLVIFENNGIVKRSGFGYDKGMYNISKDFSLVINDVQVHNEGIYICNVTDFDTGIAFQDDTLVSVVAQPREPFPTILECLHDESDLSYCSVPAETALTITCQVSGYYPYINLNFLYGSRKVEILGTKEWNNTDGTKNKTIAIAALGSEELYTCVASNIPGTRLNRSTSALLHVLHNREHFSRVVLVAVLTYSKNSKTQKDYPALQKHVNDTMMKHYRRIYDLIYTKSTHHPEIIIRENRTALFDTEKMLTDWRQSTAYNYLRFIEVLKDAISTTDTSDYAWPSNEELRWISRHLNQESMKEICKKLKITCETEDNDDEEKRYNTLREWRNKVALQNLEKKYNQLSSAIGSDKLTGLLPPLKGGFIYKAELVDKASDLVMQDLLPVTEAMGINAMKLVSYRPAFQPSHLESGTFSLLSRLLNSVIVNRPGNSDKRDIRISFYSRIGRLAYYNVAARGLLVYEMSYGELHAISEAITSSKEKAAVTQGDTSEAATQSEEDRSEGGAASNIHEGEKMEAMTSITEMAGVSQGDASKAATQSEEDKCEKGAASKISKDGNEKDTDTENPENVTLQSGLVVSRGQMSESEKAVKDTETKDQRIGKRVVKIPEDLVDLQRVLQLTDRDIAHGLGSSHPITAHALFKIWKEKPRPSVFNYRAALAHELRGNQMPDLADDVIAGKYIKEQTSLEFIQNMVQGWSQEQLRSLVNLLGLSEKDEKWHTGSSFDVICQRIVYEWVADWTKEMKNSWYLINVLTKVRDTVAEVTSLRTTLKKHKDLNDKLVENGFLDLAREIMIIEQQLGYVEPNLMSRIANKYYEATRCNQSGAQSGP